MGKLLEETQRAKSLLDRVETVESVASTLAADDDRRRALLGVVDASLEDAEPVRPVIAAGLLRLSEKTVRAWCEQGVLTRAKTDSPRLLLTMRRLHDVKHFVDASRAEGRTTGLLDDVFRRLVDATWLDRVDLMESLTQIRSGVGEVRVPKPTS